MIDKLTFTKIKNICSSKLTLKIGKTGYKIGEVVFNMYILQRACILDTYIRMYIDIGIGSIH